MANRTYYQPSSFPKEFSDEEMVRDWTLSDADKAEIKQYYRQNYQLFIVIQLCAVRLYGQFLNDIHNLSPRIINYLAQQIDLPPSLTIDIPERPATLTQYRQNIMKYLGFQKFGDDVQVKLEIFLEEQAKQGFLPDALFRKAEQYLIVNRILLPGKTVLTRLIRMVSSKVHNQVFTSIYQHLTPDLRKSIDQLFTIPEGEQRSFFQQLKAYPPAAKLSSLQTYLKRYQTLVEIDLDVFQDPIIEPVFQEYLFKLTKKYKATQVTRFAEHKRYALTLCFLLETRKNLLDHLVQMHDQYIQDMTRKSRNAYEKKHRELRKRQKKAVDTVLYATHILLDWSDDDPLSHTDFWQRINRNNLQASSETLKDFQQLTERGYGDLLLARYPTLRKYFADFIHLPFAVESGNEPLMKAIEVIRQLDANELKQLPANVATDFVPKELRPALRDNRGKINRNAWEMGLALAIKDAFRSGDLYLPQSKQHLSFWDFMLNDTQWEEAKTSVYVELKQPQKQEVVTTLTQQFEEVTSSAKEQFPSDNFAQIVNGKLKLKRDDKAVLPDGVTKLQRVINASLPPIRIEELLMEVDQLTGFSRHFTPIQGHTSRPEHFYKSLMAVIISQATNLGIVSMSASVNGITLDMLRQVLHFFIREETIAAASTEIVDRHHQLPLSAVHGTGAFSSSDAQRFRIRASSLMAAYYPRYYGYYEKAIGIYTHVSDQYSVFSTRVISCSPREALYVLDGLLENNTILQPQKHTTDTHGYTEIVFALCHLLGYDFMPRIRDLKDQQLYRIDKTTDYGAFSPLLNKTADLPLVEEQWESMIRVVLSLRQRTVPAHIVVQRLTSSYPSDRLSKAFTNLGRILKTQYILRYITDPELRRMVQRQLNKGEYRHKLPRRVFFADQGEFTTGDYEEIMNKASCLSLVSNAILYWNTIKINEIVESLRRQGEVIDDEMLSHISLLPYRHVIPNGTYFNN